MVDVFRININQEGSMSKFLLVCSCVLWFFASVPGNATMLSYTDMETRDGFNINYMLEYEQSATGYSAKFTIDSSNSTHDGDWYIGAVSFKFFEGAFETMLAFNDTYYDWYIAVPGETHIDGWSVTNNWAGFYHAGAGQSFNTLDETTRFTVGDIRTFDFIFQGEGIPYADYMPFRVGYWDGLAGQSQNVMFNQLSAQLNAVPEAIPEPSTMILLGCGLFTLFIFGRRYRQT